jgi:hypothetical protein
MSELNQPPGRGKQDYGKRKAIYFFLAVASLGVSLLSTHIGNRFPVGSTTRGVFLGFGALFLILTFCCFYADRWNKFKSERTDKGAEAFLFFNRIGEGFYSVMIALARFLSAGAGYFLKKKSRVEQNQQLILDRMQEMNDENRRASGRIETKLDSLSSDLADNAKILAAIREDNEAALSRHLEREEQLKAEIADLKDRIESLQASDDHSLAEEIAQLRNKLEETWTDLSNEQAHIEQLEEKKESLEKVDVAEITFESLLTVPAAKKKSEELEKMARGIAEASKGKSKKYQYELAKFYCAMDELGYLWGNETAFTLFFYEDYGKCRGISFDSYRRSLNYAISGLNCLEYTKYKDEIREIVLG